MYILQQTLASLAFSIVTEVDMGEPLNFIAPSETDFYMWTDGINSLLGYTVGLIFHYDLLVTFRNITFFEK